MCYYKKFWIALSYSRRGVNISLRLLKPSIKRTRSEGIDGAGFNNIEDFLNKRFHEISQLMFRQLKKHQNELSEPSEIIDIFLIVGKLSRNIYPTFGKPKM